MLFWHYHYTSGELPKAAESSAIANLIFSRVKGDTRIKREARGNDRHATDQW